MKLLQILYETTVISVKRDMENYFDECMTKYFPEYKNKFDRPNFDIKKHRSRGGWFSSDNTIWLNSVYMNTDFRGTIFHETIHYIQFHTYSRQQYNSAPNGGHDHFFISMMNKINAAEGSEVVSIRIEAVDYSAKEYSVGGVKFKDGTYYMAKLKHNDDEKEIGIMHDNRNSDIERLKNVAKRYGSVEIFVFRTTDGKLLTQLGKQTSKGFTFAVMKDKEDNVPNIKNFIELANKNIIHV